jgi:hypothetical protein
MAILDRCIEANTDISGVGTRIATYLQNFLCFVPAIIVLKDRRVTRTELETLEKQSVTILIVAFALLFSTIIQAKISMLSNFHASIILNMSWMNNTNTFIYFLLYIHHWVGKRTDVLPKVKGWIKSLIRDIWSGQLAREVMRAVLGKTNSAKAEDGRFNEVFVLGSLHLSLTGAVGIWLWSHPVTFGDSKPSCDSAVFGAQVTFTSKGLQAWSLLIYSIVLLPGFNLIIPATLFFGAYSVVKWVTGPWRVVEHLQAADGNGLDQVEAQYPKSAHERYHGTQSRLPVILGLAILVVINIFFVVDTEVALVVNASRLEPGDSVWGFGQTLAVLLVLVTFRELLETIWERNPKKLGKILLELCSKPPIKAARFIAIEMGADLDIAGEKYQYQSL